MLTIHWVGLQCDFGGFLIITHLRFCMVLRSADFFSSKNIFQEYHPGQREITPID